MAETAEPKVSVLTKTKIFVTAGRNATIDEAIEEAKHLAIQQDCVVVLNFNNRAIEVRRDTDIGRALKDYRSHYPQAPLR